MYTEYWNMKCFPFENAPDPKFFFESSGHREAMERLMFVMETHKPLAVITGDYGSGKTVLCQTAIKKLRTNEFGHAFITNPRMDSLDITREIVYQLGGEEFISTSKYDVLHSLNNLLDHHAATGGHCVVIIDEAQLITDPLVLEDLRLLLNHQSGGRFLLTLVLVGQTELNDMIRSIPQMAQRIGFKFHIPHLDPGETRPYMRHRLETAGSSLDIFQEPAIIEVERLSKGSPREINALCDISLLTASLSEKKEVTVDDVLEAGTERMQ